MKMCWLELCQTKINLTIPSVCVLVCLSCTANIQPRHVEVYVRFPSESKLLPNMFQVIVFLDASTVVRKSPLNWNYSKWRWDPAYGYSRFMQKRHPVKQEDLSVWVGCRKCSSYTHLPLQFTPTLGTVLCISQGEKNNILLRNQHCLPKERNRNVQQEYSYGGHFNSFCPMLNSIGCFCLSMFSSLVNPSKY